MTNEGKDMTLDQALEYLRKQRAEFLKSLTWKQRAAAYVAEFFVNAWVEIECSMMGWAIEGCWEAWLPVLKWWKDLSWFGRFTVYPVTVAITAVLFLFGVAIGGGFMLCLQLVIAFFRGLAWLFGYIFLKKKPKLDEQ